MFSKTIDLPSELTLEVVCSECGNSLECSVSLDFFQGKARLSIMACKECSKDTYSQGYDNGLIDSGKEKQNG